jgi:hypothetical protein
LRVSDGRELAFLASGEAAATPRRPEWFARG